MLRPEKMNYIKNNSKIGHLSDIINLRDYSKDQDKYINILENQIKQDREKVKKARELLRICELCGLPSSSHFEECHEFKRIITEPINEQVIRNRIIRVEFILNSILYGF